MAFQSEQALAFLSRSKQIGRLAHAYLIQGPKAADLEGFAGKFLSLVSGKKHELLQDWSKEGALIIRPESKSRMIKIEAIREEVGPFIYITSSASEHRLCVFVDAERMNIQAQNAFLRMLEEPPARTLYLLLSHHPEQFLETIMSRVIRVELIPEQKEKTYSSAQKKLFELLSNLSNQKGDSVASAMSLRREFESLLESVHSELEKAQEAEFDAQKKHFKQTTDVDSSWLKEKEQEAEAAIESKYRLERDQLIEGLLTWMGDVLRHQAGVDRLDLPEYAAETAKLAQRWDSHSLNHRIQQLRKLHSHLNTNVSEGLALDVAFLSCFA